MSRVCKIWILYFMVHASYTLAIALALAFMSQGLRSASATDESPTERGRILIIGIDGAAPERVGEWRAAGLLPNLDRLAREGAYGPIRSDEHMLSPRVWTSVVTGKHPRVHGIEAWVHSNGPRKGRMYRGTDRRGHALWNIFSDRGRRIGVVNRLITHPVEQIDGVMISDFAIPGQRTGRLNMMRKMGRDETLPPLPADASATTWPAEWEARIESIAADRTPLALPPVVDITTARPSGFNSVVGTRASFADDIAARTALAIHKDVRPELLLVLMQGIDRMSHIMWAGVAPPSAYPEELRRPASRRAHMRNVLKAYYAYTDRLIGKLIEPFGPDDLVIVLSDHGFEAVVNENAPRLTGGHNSEAARHGVVFARGRGIRAGSHIEGMTVFDVTPTVLAWAGLPIADDMQGRVASFVNVAQKPSVPTYAGEIQRLDAPAEEIEDAVLDQLRTLGYIQ